MTHVPVERSNLTGASFALLAAMFFSINDVAIKFLSDGYALHQVVLIRACVALVAFAVLILPFREQYGTVVFRTRRPGAHALRGVCIVFANTFLFLGLAALPIADAVAVFFVSPLVITVFSVIFLREKVGARRWSAVAVGFAGVIVDREARHLGLSVGVALPDAGGHALCGDAYRHPPDRRHRERGDHGGLFAVDLSRGEHPDRPGDRRREIRRPGFTPISISWCGAGGRLRAPITGCSGCSGSAG